MSISVLSLIRAIYADKIFEALKRAENTDNFCWKNHRLGVFPLQQVRRRLLPAAS